MLSNERKIGVDSMTKNILASTWRAVWPSWKWNHIFKTIHSNCSFYNLSISNKKHATINRFKKNAIDCVNSRIFAKYSTRRITHKHWYTVQFNRCSFFRCSVGYDIVSKYLYPLNCINWINSNQTKLNRMDINFDVQSIIGVIVLYKLMREREKNIIQHCSLFFLRILSFYHLIRKFGMRHGNRVLFFVRLFVCSFIRLLVCFFASLQQFCCIFRHSVIKMLTWNFWAESHTHYDAWLVTNYTLLYDVTCQSHIYLLLNDCLHNKM